MQRKTDIDQSQPLLINEEKRVYLTPRRILRNSSLNSNGNSIAMKHRVLIISSLFAFLLFVHIIIFSNVKIYNHNIQVEGWAKNVSRDTVEYVLPNENTTIIEPPSLCAPNSDPIFLLIVVCSSASNFEHRQTIRETWGNTSQFNYPYFGKFHARASNNNSYLNINYKQWKKYAEIPKNSSAGEKSANLTNFRVKVVFLVGISPHYEVSDEQQYEINYENDMYGDIIQENFLDSYNNLTLKSILLLKWVTNNCIDKVKYIMKCDDDTFINVPNLVHVLLGGTVPLYKSTISYYDKNSILVTKSKNRLPDTKNLLMGYKFCNAKKIQDVTSKWYAPAYMFDGEYYPNYLSGTAYIFTFDTARALYEESLRTQVFHLEDVYLTGFVAERIKMRRSHHPLFFYQYNKDKCSLRGMISQHQITPMEMTEAYNFVTNLTIHCAVPDKNFSTSKLVLAQRKRCH